MATPMEPMENDLGVVFVHGIGQQTEGDTLVRFGEPLREWIERWLTADQPQRGAAPVLEVVEAWFRRRPDDPTAPPHARMRLRPVEKTLLVAEAWWAESFPVPDFGEFLGWTFGVVPDTVALHFGKRLRQALQRFRDARGSWRRLEAAWGFVRSFAYLLLSPIFAALLLVGLVLIFVLSVPGLRGLAVRLKRALVATIGDSFVLLGSPIREAAILAQVRQVLSWVAKRSKAVAIVAHSQGAAVAHFALRSELPDMMNPDRTSKRRLLITFGSGLGKLDEIQQLRVPGEKPVVWLLVGLALIAIGLLAAPRIGIALTIWLASVGGLMCFSGMAWSVQGIKPKAEDFDPQKCFPPPGESGIVWKDYFASSDPVPNGPLFDPEDTPAYLQDKRGDSVEVYNRASNFSDHNAYWKNLDQFISAVARALGELIEVDFKAIQPDHDKANDEKRIELASHRRRWRVGWLGGTRAATTIAATILLVSLYLQERLKQVGQAIVQWISEHLPEWRILGWLQGKLGMVLEWIKTPEVVAITSVLLASWLLFTLASLAWRWWEARDVHAFFAREDYVLGGLPLTLFVCSALMLVDVLLLAALPLPLERRGSEIGRILLSPLLAGGFAYVWFACRMLIFNRPLGFSPRPAASVFDRLGRALLKEGLLPSSWPHYRSSGRLGRALKEGLLAFVLATLVSAVPFGVLWATASRWDTSREFMGKWSWIVVFSLAVLSSPILQHLAPRVKKQLTEKGAAGPLTIALADQLRQSAPGRTQQLLAERARELLQEHAKRVTEFSQATVALLERTLQLDVFLAQESIGVAERLRKDPSLRINLLEVPARFSEGAALRLAELQPDRAEQILEPFAQRSAKARKALRKLSRSKKQAASDPGDN